MHSPHPSRPSLSRQRRHLTAARSCRSISHVDASSCTLSTQINPHVAHYTGQQELAEAIQEGLRARKEGDIEGATVRLGRAVALANESGNTRIAGLLDRVVDVIDPVTGTVRLKHNVTEADEMALDTRSTRTVRVRKDTL